MWLITLFFFVNNAECSKMEGRIVGGEFTTINHYPYQVYLEIHRSIVYLCGGSFLNQALILTAAHCLEDHIYKVYIKYGSEDLKKTKMRRMKAFKLHPDYNMNIWYADLALVQCRQAVILGDKVQRVAIMSNPPKRTHAVVAGWGLISENNDYTETLKHIRQKILYRKKKCNGRPLPKGTFCARSVGNFNNIPDGYPSFGDSGGPLVIDNFIQIGIVSYRVNENNFVAYTNVSYFMPWIIKAAHKMYCSS